MTGRFPLPQNGFGYLSVAVAHLGKNVVGIGFEQFSDCANEIQRRPIRPKRLSAAPLDLIRFHACFDLVVQI